MFKKHPKEQPVPVQTTVTQKPVEPKIEDPTPTAGPDDGLRLPDMLGLPNESEFRSTNPDVKKSPTGDGPVISRPPTDPPSRPKPVEKTD